MSLYKFFVGRPKFLQDCKENTSFLFEINNDIYFGIYFVKLRDPNVIPPILWNATFITNICEKITLFSTFFADQCTPINNSSTLPTFEYKINSKIEDVSFSEHEIVSIICSLNSNKAHGWDGISIRMIIMYDELISPPLKIIFDTALQSGIYPYKRECRPCARK